MATNTQPRRPINISNENISKIQNSKEEEEALWYCAKTGIYRSKHPSIQLPSDPFLDVVSFIVDSQSGFSISYAMLHSLVKSTAAGLHRIGVSQGDVVLILLPNSVYFPVIFLGILSVGAIAAAMNPLSSLLEIKKQAFDCNVRLAFATPDRVENLGAALGNIPVIGLPESLNLDSTANNGYGMTESTAVGTRGYNTAKLRKYFSVGLLAPNMEAKVIELTTGSSLPPNRTGELWLRGPGIMKGYLNNVEASKDAVDDDGWLHTGDIVYFDEDGYLYVKDRLKEMIKYKGFQIAPADLEAVLMSHPNIIDAAVTSANNEEVGEIPVAFVVKREGSELSQSAVIDFVAKQVAPYKKVRRVYLIKSIPKSAAGKILRKELKTLLTSKM